MRLVVTKRNYETVLARSARNTAEPVSCDTYRERLIKYAPVEIIALYVCVYGIGYAVMGTTPYFSFVGRWILMAGIAGTLLYLWKAEGVSDAVQLLVSAIGFVAWVFALGVIPVSELPWYNQIAASIVLPIYIFGTPLIDGMPDRF
ncbi:hypothetical protein [uncultured Methanoregula sp.]|uniref:hypothetical protein n=1 Tax=uncultured Methanoregula sp. TaxID=1005933 RepID=UPI002AAAE3BD|nr:hypothetical protein [uncultured Methanoregula sp.]